MVAVKDFFCMFQRLRLIKNFILIFVAIFILLGLRNHVYAASEVYNMCSSILSGTINVGKIGTSCNTQNFTIDFPLSVVDQGGKAVVSGNGTYAYGLDITQFPLLNYFDSISSDGTAYQRSGDNYYGNPYTPLGFIIEKQNYNPYINFSLNAKYLPGIGGLTLPEVMSSSNGSDYPLLKPFYFPVPYLGKAADLFTLGTSIFIDNQYNINNLPNPAIETSTPNNLYGSVSQNEFNNECAGSSTGNLDCKLLYPYGDPYTPTSENAQTTIYGYVTSNGGGGIFQSILNGISSFFGYIYGFLTGNSMTSPIQQLSAPYCSNTISQFNTTDTLNNLDGTNVYQESTPFTINIPSCNISDSACVNNLKSEVANLKTQTTSSALGLQGVNRILADEWYYEASLDEGPPIGHTNINAWNQYVNKSTYYLKSAVLNVLKTGQGTYDGQNASQIQNNLFSGIGINVNANLALFKNPPSSACMINASNQTPIYTTGGSFYYPWLGNAPIIEQNLDFHKFQPFFQNPDIPGSTSTGLSPLPAGEYYIKDRSQFPDPMLLYLIYTGAVSTNDPVVANALGSYNPYACVQSGQTPTPNSPQPLRGNTKYRNPLRQVANLYPERIDQGVDYSGTGPIYALGPGTIVNVYAPSNSGWGPPTNSVFIDEHLSSGPASGLYVYAAECIHPTVSVGQNVTSSTVIGDMFNCGYGIETGWAVGPSEIPGDIAMALPVFNHVSSTDFGLNYDQLLTSLGAPSGHLILPVTGTLPAGWPTW